MILTFLTFLPPSTLDPRHLTLDPRPSTKTYTHQGVNAMFTVLFRLFLEGLELNLHRHMLWQNPSQLRSLLRF